MLETRRSLVAIIAFLTASATIFLIEQIVGGPVGNLAECTVAIGVLVVLIWATRGMIRDSFLAIASLLAGLTIVDGVLWAQDLRTSASNPMAATYDSGLTHSRPIVGWGARTPGVFRVVRKYPNDRIIYDVHVTIDATLNRKTVPSADHGSIAFFGDSVIFGDGLNDNETLPQLFATLNDGKIPVWNLAFSGWSPSQNLAALQAGMYKPLLQSPRRFILFTSSFHVERTACKDKWAVAPSPRFVIVGDKIVNRGPCGTQIEQTLSRFAERFPLYERIAPLFAKKTPNDVTTFLKIIGTFSQVAKRDYNAETTIIYKMMEADYLQGTGFNQETLLEAIRKTGIDVLVEPTPPRGEYALYEIEGDHHPTGFANRLTARQIENHLKTVDPAALEVGDHTATTP